MGDMRTCPKCRLTGRLYWCNRCLHWLCSTIGCGYSEAAKQDIPLQYDIVERLQRLVDTAEDRQLDGTEVRYLKDAIYEITRLRGKK